MTGSAQNLTRFGSVVMGVVIGLTFLFGFGNVLTLALNVAAPLLVGEWGKVAFTPVVRCR